MVRLPSILAFGLVVYLTIAIAKQQHLAAHTAWLSGAIVATTPSVSHYAHLGTQDLPLVAAELLGVWALLKAAQQPRWLWLTGACVGLGFLLKSFMIALPMVALIPYLWQQRWRPLRSVWLYGGLLLGAIPVLVWLGLASQRHGALVWQQLFGKLLYLGESNVHATGWWYYLWNLPLNGFPWVLLALAACALDCRGQQAVALVDQLAGERQVLNIQQRLFNVFPGRDPGPGGHLTGLAIERLGFVIASGANQRVGPVVGHARFKRDAMVRHDAAHQVIFGFLAVFLGLGIVGVVGQQAIRQVNPAAKLVQTEDLGKNFSTPLLAYQAEFENQRRWLSFDLLCGRVDR
ncbi:MAG: phospholipid carrier-dependent glycosyltransferase, partial [Synechococcaceae cyanobacterium SM2_3_60]|nr:phospholipid carrier-dependent glycosyltransferase [Synechococcaceae cyanobacterium SM2_3_60]